MIIKNINFLNNNDNKTLLIGLLTLLIGVWLILYFIPSFFVSLFNTILGRLILLLIVIVISINNYKYGLMIGLIFIILIRFVELIRISKKEGFDLSQKSITDFLQIQYTINPKIVFDIEEIKKQASQEEIDYFLKNGMWPWSKEVIDLYKEAINKNKIIRTYSEDSVNYARTIYNQKAILTILSMQTKEGSFLLSGVQINDGKKNRFEDLPSGFGDFGYEAGLMERMYPVIKCKLDENGDSSLEKTIYTGKGGIFGEQTSIKSKVEYNNLEKEIPGFKFIKTSCNPCMAFNSLPDYSCPFNLTIKEEKKEKKDISSVWKYLWGIK